MPSEVMNLQTGAPAPAISEPTGEYLPPLSDASRSPCPALNTLANHGYILRTGRDLGFFEIVKAVNYVYNLSYPLCFFLVLGGFLTCGKLQAKASRQHSVSKYWQSLLDSCRHGTLTALILWGIDFIVSLLPFAWTLDLDRLSERGFFRIAHNASFVHLDDKSSRYPDPGLLRDLLKYPAKAHGTNSPRAAGFQLEDIAYYHASRLDKSIHKPNVFHNKIALGESALLFLMLRGKIDADTAYQMKTDHWLGTVSLGNLEQWLGEERLPDAWWAGGRNGLRPRKPIGIWEAHMTAVKVGLLAERRFK